MNIIVKHSTKKKIVTFSTIVSGFVTLIALIAKFGSGSLSNISSISEASSALDSVNSSMSFIIILFYVFLIGSILLAILSGYYFFKKNNKEYVILTEFIGSAINSLLLLLSISGVNAIAKAIKAVSSNDYEAVFSLYTKIGDIQNAATYIKYFAYLSIILFIVNIFIWLIVKGIVKVDAISFNFDEDGVINQQNSSSIQFDSDAAKELGKTGVDSAKNGLNNVSSFLKTKNGRIVLSIVAAVVVLFGDYKVYDTYFNKTDLNVMPKISIEFNGKDGAGYVSDFEHGALDYDYNDSELRDFVNSISYDYGSSQKLKNGDEIKVHAVYDKEKAKSLKLNIVNDTTTVKVRGLTVSYKDADSVPSKILKQAKEDIEDGMASDYASSSYRKYSYELDSIYFAKGKSNDSIVAVYKVDSTSKGFFSDTEETSTYYVYAKVEDVASDYLKDDSHYVTTYTLDDPDSYEELTDVSKVKPALEDQFNRYTLTEFK